MSESRHARWLAAVQAPDAPHDLSLAAAAGDELRAAPPWPDLTVLGVEVTHVRRLVMQSVTVRAHAIDEGDGHVDLVIARLVAEVEGDAEIEIMRVVTPAGVEAALAPDLTTCTACARPIIRGEAVELDGGAYHRNCLSYLD
jgi:hypothetical protein